MLASFSDSQEWTNQFPSYCLHLHSHPYVQATGEPSELERPRSDLLRMPRAACLCRGATDDTLVLQVRGISPLCHTGVPHSAAVSVAALPHALPLKTASLPLPMTSSTCLRRVLI